ncbi:hypothetical protein YC2023_053329 [Brassica napus]
MNPPNKKFVVIKKLLKDQRIVTNRRAIEIRQWSCNDDNLSVRCFGRDIQRDAIDHWSCRIHLLTILGSHGICNPTPFLFQSRV